MKLEDLSHKDSDSPMIAKSNALLKDSQILRMILFAYLYRLKMQIRFKKLFVHKTTKEDRKDMVVLIRTEMVGCIAHQRK